MSHLSDIYEQLARPWSPEQLADQYRNAIQSGERIGGPEANHLIRRPVAMLATAVPACSTLSVAIHVIHVVPNASTSELVDQLLRTAGRSSTSALHRCQKALELDARARGYSADEWLPTVCDIAAPLLGSARLADDPPSLVRYAQETVTWVSRGIVELDQDAPDAAAAITDAIGRALALRVFVDVARR